MTWTNEVKSQYPKFIITILMIRTCQVNKLMLNSHGEVILGVNDDIRRYDLPSDSGRIPILTVRIVNLFHSAGIKQPSQDWGTRNDGTSSYRKSKSLSEDIARCFSNCIFTPEKVFTNCRPSNHLYEHCNVCLRTQIHVIGR